MSGGSWDYLYGKMDDAAGRLLESPEPARRAFGRLMEKAAKAMHDIEWVDSCDFGPGDEMEAIHIALGKSAQKAILEETIEEAKAVQAKLTRAIEAAEKERQR